MLGHKDANLVPFLWKPISLRVFRLDTFCTAKCECSSDSRERSSVSEFSQLGESEPANDLQVIVTETWLILLKTNINFQKCVE